VLFWVYFSKQKARQDTPLAKIVNRGGAFRDKKQEAIHPADKIL